MKILKCIFSGQDVLKAKGMYKVAPDGRVNLLVNRKSRSHFERKVKSQKVLWTLGSRFFHKKGASMHKEKKVVFKLPKIVRGFPLDPRKAVEEIRERKESTERRDSQFKKTEKVSKNVNLRR